MKLATCEDIAVTRHIQYITKKQLHSLGCGHEFGRYLGQFSAPKHLQIKLTLNIIQADKNLVSLSNDTFVVNDYGQLNGFHLDGYSKTATAGTYSSVAELHLGQEWQDIALLIATQGKCSTII